MKQSFKGFYEKSFDRIYGYIYRYCCDIHDAEDICSQVFMKIYKNWDRISTNELGYSYQTAQNCVFDFFRQKKRGQVFDTDIIENVGSDGVALEELTDREDLIRQIRERIFKLPIRLQQILSLYYFEEKTYQEIAELLGLSLQNVRVMKHRAISKLKLLMNAHEN